MARKKGEGVTTEEMRAIGCGEFVGWTPSEEGRGSFRVLGSKGGPFVSHRARGRKNHVAKHKEKTAERPQNV
jgi:hypothetical protein